MSGRLVVCPTPIGNLEDVTLRVLSALRDADVVACEDTRRTRVLLDRYGVSAKMLSYHEHNERERSAELVGRMQEGAVVALVSDAGMPLVSDPGFVLVQACVAAGIGVEVLPGPSAALAALVVSGLPAETWRFAGFLPRKAGALRELVAAGPDTIVAFESPKRLAASLAVVAEVDPSRPVAVARELTKLHEEVARGTAAELAERYAAEDPRGEIVVVIGGAPVVEGDLGPALDALRRLVAAGAKARPAAAVVADMTGVPANALYRALTAKSPKDARLRSASAPLRAIRVDLAPDPDPPARIDPVRGDGARLRHISVPTPCHRRPGDAPSAIVVRVVLRLALAAALVLALPGGAVAQGRWHAPVPGPVVAGFAYDAARPFAPGQRRGVALHARAGAPVRAACTGRVTFAGRVPDGGRGVTIRCGPLLATHLGLGTVAVRRGAAVPAGTRVGTAGAGGAVRLGARRAGDPQGYVDPGPLVDASGPGVAPPVGGSRRAPRAPGVRGRWTAPRPVAAGRDGGGAPLLAWAGLGLLAAACAGGVVVRRPWLERGRGGTAPVPR